MVKKKMTLEQFAEKIDRRLNTLDEKFNGLSNQIEILAVACAKNFKMIDERFKKIDERFERIERRMNLAEIRWQKISNTVLHDHEPRISKIENKSIA